MCSKRRRQPDRPKRRLGFTLVELMVVIVLIGLLAGAVTLATRSYLVSGKQAVVRMEISKICQAIDTFYAAYDRYPTSDEGLAILTQASAKFEQGLLSKLPIDPWGRPYEYLQPGRDTAYEILCYGADGREGGEGADRDLSSRDLDRQQAKASKP